MVAFYLFNNLTLLVLAYTFPSLIVAYSLEDIPSMYNAYVFLFASCLIKLAPAC